MRAEQEETRTKYGARRERPLLSLEEARELMLGSPFDYERSALVYLPTDMPEPNSPGYQQAVERVTGELIAALEGRTLILFTSYSQLRATYQALKAPLESRQVVLLGQRMDGASRSRLLEEFKSGDRVALMGTSSFWEGVDVVGDAVIELCERRREIGPLEMIYEPPTLRFFTARFRPI